MSTPDHVENTGDNLRKAAEVQQDALDGRTDVEVPDDQSGPKPLPDFNT